MKPPVVIGALGGSGTRVVARIVRHACFFTGTRLNASEDAMEFVEFYDRWINRFVRRNEVLLTDTDTAKMDSEFIDCITSHRADMPEEDENWGWKEPRSIYLLTFFHNHFPVIIFIHVIRDGRDMAFSSNQNQLRKHGNFLLDSRYDAFAQPIRTAVLWNHVNLTASDYGEREMGDHYLCIRFEDLCRDAKATVRRIAMFLENKIDMDNVLKEIVLPESIGRWQSCDDLELPMNIANHAKQALVRFGYV